MALKCVTTRGKNVFANAIKLKTLQWGRLLEEPDGPEVISRDLIRGKEEGTMSKDLTMGQR